MANLYVKFRTLKGHYVYDSIANRLLKVSRLVYDALEACLDEQPIAHTPCPPSQLTADDIRKARRVVDRLRATLGVLSVKSLRERGTLTTPTLVRDSVLRTGLAGCSLELTELCNFRCRYCTYSGGYSQHRVHGRRSMPWAVAKKAIDLYLSLTQTTAASDSDHLGVGFYGGEPFLRFSEMRRIMEYTKQHELLKGRTVLFHGTTNGSLLTDDILSYLQENAFGLLVSLDGPREQHDRNRRYNDGRPTFDDVYARVQQIRRLYPQYLRRSVSFSVVLAPQNDLMEIDRFFSECELSTEGRSRFRSGGVASGNSQYDAQNPPYDRRSEHLASLRSDYLASHMDGRRCRPFVRQMFERPFLSLHTRRVLSSEETWETPPLPICVPGQRKLYVSCDGTLHMCEKVGAHMPIGCVNTGIDFEAASSLMNRYYQAANAKSCKTCWAHRFCPECFARVSVQADGSFAFDGQSCNQTRTGLENIMRAYCQVSEANPGAWEYLNEYIIA